MGRDPIVGASVSLPVTDTGAHPRVGPKAGVPMEMREGSVGAEQGQAGQDGEGETEKEPYPSW